MGASLNGCAALFKAKRHTIGIVVDVLSLIVVLGLAAYAYKGLRPFERGFFCDDERISYPHQTRSTVPTLTQILWSFLAPPALVIVVEIMCALKTNTLNSRLTLFNILYWIYRIIYGLGLVIFVTMALKNITGRLRPDFLSVCQPDYTSIDCNAFVTNVTCLQTEQIDYARTSFPSGHTSLAFHSAMVASMYLTLRASWKITDFLLPILQSIFFLLASYSAISRIRDNKHHWEDVTVGCILGLILGVAVFREHLPDLIKGTSHPDKIPLAAPRPDSEDTSNVEIRMNQYAESRGNEDVVVRVN